MSQAGLGCKHVQLICIRSVHTLSFQHSSLVLSLSWSLSLCNVLTNYSSPLSLSSCGLGGCVCVCVDGFSPLYTDSTGLQQPGPYLAND